MSNRTEGGRVSVVGIQPDDDTFVVPLADIDDLRGWHVPARVVVDARQDDLFGLPVLAQLVLIRRRLRAAGGDVVLAVNPRAAGVLRASGLHWAVACGDEIAAAVSAVRPPSP